MSASLPEGLTGDATAIMTDQDDLPTELASIPREQLKHGKGRYKDVILVPQPSDSPNDPLNVRRLVFVRPSLFKMDAILTGRKCLVAAVVGPQPQSPLEKIKQG